MTIMIMIFGAGQDLMFYSHCVLFIIAAQTQRLAQT